MSIKLENSQSSYQCFQRWCTAGPIPAKLLVDTPEGEKTLLVDANRARVWGNLHRALISMQAVTVEAQNDAGEVLRRFDVTAADDTEPEPEPELKLPMPGSEDARMLAMFAQLLSQAYRHGADSQRQSSESAFKMLVQLAESQMKRAEALERTVMRMRSGAAAPEDSGGGGGNDLMAMVAQFMQGQAMAAAQKVGPVVNGTNGVHVPASDEGEEQEEEEAD